MRNLLFSSQSTLKNFNQWWIITTSRVIMQGLETKINNWLNIDGQMQIHLNLSLSRIKCAQFPFCSVLVTNGFLLTAFSLKFLFDSKCIFKFKKKRRMTFLWQCKDLCRIGTKRKYFYHRWVIITKCQKVSPRIQ